MGCASSKRTDIATGVHRPPPTTFAVFDINAIEEPWLKTSEAQLQHDEKPARVPALILEKLNAIEDAPCTWEEVSKALEDIKPALQYTTSSSAIKTSHVKVKSQVQDSAVPGKQEPRKGFTFHTLEEFDATLSSMTTDKLRKTESMRTELQKADSVKLQFKKSQSSKPNPEMQVVIVPDTESRTATVSDGYNYKPVKENIFIVRDRIEREEEGKVATFVKRDPLSECPEKCPPGGADSVVIYTTTLGGVRRTFEDCNKVRSILEYHRVAFDERDVSLHGEFLSELRELVEEEASVPRMFVKGRYIGGADEVVSLNETGRLGRILNWARVEKGLGRPGCEGCGGARFVPCLGCRGSRKILVGNEKQRCPECNENGLVHCPACA